MFTKQFTFGNETVNVEIDFAALPQAAQAFIIDYGLKQYLSDGAAVSKDDAESEDARNTLKADGVRDRVVKLKAGTMSVRGGTRTTDPVAKIKRELAIEILRAHYKANDMKLPKGEELTVKIANFWERNGDKPQVKAELDKRVKALSKLQSLGELDL